MSSHRAAHTINSCLSVQNIPSTVEFDAADVFGGINQHMDNVNNDALARVDIALEKFLTQKFNLLDEGEYPQRHEEQLPSAVLPTLLSTGGPR